MVRSAALLMRDHGVAATSIARVLEHSGAPRGSVGHHFPGGRRELVEDALVWAGSQIGDRLRAAVDEERHAASAYARVCRDYEMQLVATDFTAGCPVGAAMQEVHHDEALAPVVAGVVSEWQGVLSEALVADGHARGEADALAQLAIACLEGAIMTARVSRSVAPVQAVAARISPLLLAGAGRPT